MPKPKSTLPLDDPCALLQQARGAMYLLCTGGAVAEVETPQLGRVVYTPGKIADLQRVIDSLASQCAAANGITNTSVGRRKPISIEAWP